MENFWPDDISKIEYMPTPKMILEKQGEYLEKATKGTIYVNVKQEETLDRQKFKYKFELVGKLLNNYTYKILTITHDVEIYPFKIWLDESISKELDISSYYDIEVKNQNEFEDLLKKIFSSEKMHGLISSILSLSQ